eukprot:CAMPEP_0182581158 /NCGR_PEP_ID=MMETSP1324-20130603/49149_1 /TAXON_ID=236786 /ORGANISM="Florenciella sp., Strain RCC1587" /LENGTH=380 /DNA_ID=CAMNT_0024797483 /DNA_START=217 /DNA_END=1356 /DNA_ORIENTATION=+
MADAAPKFPILTEVIVVGTEYDGCVGRVSLFDPSAQTYIVQLDDGRVSEPLAPDELKSKAEADRRAALMAIQRDKTKSAAEKAQMMQRQMSGSSGAAAEEEPPTATALSERALSAKDVPGGCKHYTRSCVIIPVCCGRPYECRLCHDEHENHEIDRHATQEIICKECDHRQPVSNACMSCGVVFGEYFCGVCRMWDARKSEEAAGKYHCDKCGICRVGAREDYIHCDRCSMCQSASQTNHTCFGESQYKSDCPVCRCDLFGSRIPALQMRCGHPIHTTCYDELSRADYRCPLCKKSICDMSLQWDLMRVEISTQPMPPEYAKTISVFCNDCEATSQGERHFIGTPCGECGSFNTAATGNDAEDEDEDEDDGEGEGEGEDE